MRLTEPEQLLHAVPGTTLRLTPISAGGFNAELTILQLDGIVFQGGFCSPAVIMAEATPGHSTVQLPFAGIETFILNGRLLAPGVVGLYGGGGSLERVSQQTTSHAALILPTEDAEFLLAAPSASALLSGGQAMLQAHPVPWQRAVELFRSILAAVEEDPAMPLKPEVRRSLRASLLDAVREVIWGDEHSGLPRQLRNSPARQRIVNVANDFLSANPGSPIYTEDLCRVLGISPARLADAFRASFGISPHRFLKLRRLAMVRSALRDCGTGVPPTARTIVQAHGFWHLGQFARDYRAHYGETPSETRARTWGLVPSGAQDSSPEEERTEEDALLRQA